MTSSNAALTVVLSPNSQTNYASSTATFTAPSFGQESLNYQWQKNGTNLVNGGNLSGATNGTLTIANLSDADATIYSAVVGDATSSVTTSNATLTVIDPPIITGQPSNLVVLPGTNAAFGISLTGTAPFHYQWRFNSANILNATNAIYAFQVVGTTNAGNYSVVVTNSAGGVTSSNALLTVFVPPAVTLQFLAGYPLLKLNGMLSSNFVVQYNTDLAGTNWITLLSLTNLSSSPYQFLDPAGVVPPERFYGRSCSNYLSVKGKSQALNNSFASLRLSQFYLHAAAETFRAADGVTGCRGSGSSSPSSCCCPRRWGDLREFPFHRKVRNP